MTATNRRHFALHLWLGLLLLGGQSLANAQGMDLKALELAARKEGRIASVGMPDNWANWRATWADLDKLYGLTHVDTDMSSAEEIAKMEAERSNASVDIGDVGFEFGAIAKARGITLAYKPTTWAQVPDWAKDADGHWAMAYTGTIAFAINKKRVASAPRSWKELFAGPYRVSIGEVGRASQSNAGILAAAIALGGGRNPPATGADRLCPDRPAATTGHHQCGPGTDGARRGRCVHPLGLQCLVVPRQDSQWRRL